MNDFQNNSSIVKTYSPDYKEQVFLIWYKAGKPGVHRLRDLLPPAENDNIPSHTILSQWVKNEFIARGDVLDEEVRSQLEAHLVKEKIEMLSRHITVSKEMQLLGLGALRNFEKLSVSAAIRLLVEGVRIERESSGIPAALAKITDKTDDELMDELQKLLEKSPVNMEIIDPTADK